MKKILSILLALTFGSILLWSCDDDEPSGTIFPKPEGEEQLNDFDKWLRRQYSDPFNINFMYKYSDIETDMAYNVVPPKREESIKLARLLRVLWLDPYVRTLDDYAKKNSLDDDAGLQFIRKTAPKQIMPIGSGAYNNNGTMMLGTAAQGLKITLYVTNQLSDFLKDPTDPTNRLYLNQFFFQTMHHEFAHILHQTINIPVDFIDLSRADYTRGNWNNHRDSEMRKKGFVSAYASSSEFEDWVETLATYVVSSPAEWNQILNMATIYESDGVTVVSAAGKEKILEKLDQVRTWLKTFWHYDIDVLHANVQAAYARMLTLDLDTMDEKEWDKDTNY